MDSPSPERQPDDRPEPRRDTPAVTVRVRRSTAGRAVWIVSLLVAFGLGWVAARRLPPLLAPDVASLPAPALEPPRVADELTLPPTLPAGEEPAETAPVPEDTAPAKPTPAPRRAERRPEPKPTPVAPQATDPEPVPLATAPGPVATADPTSERARRADRLAGEGDAEGARALAEGLLAEHDSYTGLTEALVGDGMSEVDARLSALRVVQLAGHDEIATELARELKRSYAGTHQAQEAIRDWGLLVPRIADIQTSIETDERLLVTGSVWNPDIGDIRRVFIEVEALDAAGNVLGAERTRVRPRSLEPDESGSFVVRIRGVDTAAVLSTRATVVEWESEVLGPR